MRYILSFLIMAMLVISTNAKDVWHNPPLKVGAGIYAIDTLQNGVVAAKAHVRMESRTGKETKWRFFWESDSGASSIEVVMPDSRDLLMGYSQKTVVRLLSNGKQEEKQIDTKPGAFSVKLVYDGFNARILGGYSDQESLFAAVPFFPNAKTVMGYELAQPMHCWRISSESMLAESERYISEEEMRTALEKSSLDPLVGIWEYLDREISEAQADLGGKYRLAILPEGEDEYSIVYLSGAVIGNWQPRRIKGKLVPSGFEGNYDMEWIDSSGTLLSDDNNAQIEKESGILTLRFPVYKSQMRFKRNK